MTPAEESVLVRLEGKIDLLNERLDHHLDSHRSQGNLIKWGIGTAIALAVALPKLLEFLGQMIEAASAGVLS